MIGQLPPGNGHRGNGQGKPQAILRGDLDPHEAYLVPVAAFWALVLARFSAHVLRINGHDSRQQRDKEQT